MLSTAVLLTASMVVGQAEDINVPKKVLAEFDYLVGDWTYSGEDGDDAVKGTFSVKWAPGKHAILIEMSWTDPDHTAMGTGIDGWDVAKERITTLEFWSDGWSHYREYSIKSVGVWHSDVWNGVTDEGKRITGRGIVERKGPNEFVWRSEKTTLDGKPGPNTLITFKRK
jgi:hypothetical protein